MAVRSIIEVEVVDDAFKAFSTLFDRYSQQVKEVAERQGKANSKEEGFLARKVSAFKEFVNIQDKALELQDKANKHYDLQEKKTANIARNLKSGLESLLRWAASASTFGVLSGGLGLFGLDRLAEGVGAGRKSSMGIGASYGGQKSFNTQFGPVLGDTSGFLHRIGEAQSNPGMQTGLIAAGGFSRQQIEGSTADQLAADLILRLKPMVDKESSSTIGTMSSRYKLDEYGITTEDLKRLKSMSSSEVQEHYGKYKAGIDPLSQTAQTQKSWQDFDVQLHTAGQKIENVFIKGLDGLIPGLTKLSDAFADVTAAFLSSPALKEWIKSVGDGLEHFATVIGKPEFKESIEGFSQKVFEVVKALGDMIIGLNDFVQWVRHPFGGTDEGNKKEETTRSKNWDFIKKSFGFGDSSPESKQGIPDKPNPPSNGAVGSGANKTNPGNIRGADGKFRQFGSEAEGISAMGKQLQRYQDLDKWGHLDTIDKIVNTYAPKSDHNDTEAYARNVSEWTGFKRDQKLDMHDPQQLAKIVSAMTRQEGSGKKFSPEVVVTILNAPGNNANVAAASAR